MILFNDVVQVFAGPNSHSLRQLPFQHYQLYKAAAAASDLPESSKAFPEINCAEAVWPYVLPVHVVVAPLQGVSTVEVAFAVAWDEELCRRPRTRYSPRRCAGRCRLWNRHRFPDGADEDGNGLCDGSPKHRDGLEAWRRAQKSTRPTKALGAHESSCGATRNTNRSQPRNLRSRSPSMPGRR